MPLVTAGDAISLRFKRAFLNFFFVRIGRAPLVHSAVMTSAAYSACAAAYGWPAALTDEQILERLLALNLERAAEEAKAAKAKKPKTQRGKEAGEML